MPQLIPLIDPASVLLSRLAQLQLPVPGNVAAAMQKARGLLQVAQIAQSGDAVNAIARLGSVVGSGKIAQAAAMMGTVRGVLNAINLNVLPAGAALLNGFNNIGSLIDAGQLRQAGALVSQLQGQLGALDPLRLLGLGNVGAVVTQMSGMLRELDLSRLAEVPRMTEAELDTLGNASRVLEDAPDAGSLALGSISGSDFSGVGLTPREAYLYLGEVGLDLAMPDTHNIHSKSELPLHALIERKPRMQWTGDDLDEHHISFRLHTMLGDVQPALDALELIRANHEPQPVVLASGKFIGYFVLVEMSRALLEWRGATLTHATGDITLREYVPDEDELKQLGKPHTATAVAPQAPGGGGGGGADVGVGSGFAVGSLQEPSLSVADFPSLPPLPPLPDLSKIAGATQIAGVIRDPQRAILRAGGLLQ